MKFFKYLYLTTAFILLTILTQIGGFIFLLNRLVTRYIDNHVSNKWLLSLCKIFSFLILYLICTLFVVPPLAKLLGREALPMRSNAHLRPLNVLTCLLNRHYVKPSLKTAILRTSREFVLKYPEAKLYYLDANFPFMDGFPLIPHLSHNDGRKLDLAFCYRDHTSGKPIAGAPSFIGYGICEESRVGESNTAKMCAEKGYWQYSILKKVMPQGAKERYDLDEERTATLVQLLSNQKELTKIFVEPHLVGRLKLDRSKIRFQGCHAVRHDDHIHVQ